VSDPGTLAGRELLGRHPEVTTDEVVELERQAHGQGVMAERERKERLVDALRHLLTPEQLGAMSAVIYLDPDPIATLDDDRLRFVLDGLTRMPFPGPEERAAAKEASARFLDEIM
jgi:hypothetical protein